MKHETCQHHPHNNTKRRDVGLPQPLRAIGGRYIGMQIQKRYIHGKT